MKVLFDRVFDGGAWAPLRQKGLHVFFRPGSQRRTFAGGRGQKNEIKGTMIVQDFTLLFLPDPAQAQDPAIFRTADAGAPQPGLRSKDASRKADRGGI
jgi:hypothetical protein